SWLVYRAGIPAKNFLEQILGIGMFRIKVSVPVAHDLPFVLVPPQDENSMAGALAVMDAPG
ncbi:MAG: hypothetical protein WBP60_12550, partial [Gammaproteobacteria bacterium]